MDQVLHPGVVHLSVRVRDGGANGSRVGLEVWKRPPRRVIKAVDWDSRVYVFMQYYRFHAGRNCGINAK